MDVKVEIFFDNEKLNKNKIREKWVKTYYSELYQRVINFNKKAEIKFSNKLYNYFFNISEYPMCELCLNKSKRFIGFIEGYNNFCSKSCSSKSSKKQAIKNAIKNNLEKYGVEWTSQLDSVKEKQMNTNLNRYGEVSPTLNKDVRDKQKEKMLEKYGVAYSGQNDDLLAKTFNSRFEQYKQDINVKYGDLNVLKIIKEGKLLILCDICNKEYEIKTTLLRLRKFRYKTVPCLLCNPLSSYKYTDQNEIKQFLSDHNFTFEIGNRKILKGKELDILISEKKNSY